MNITKILICDDHNLVRSGLKSYLKDFFSNDVDYFEADNGTDGLDLFEKETPQLAILDIEMPGINGLTLCEKIKEIEPNTIVVIITSHNEKILYKSVKHVKANGFLTKGASQTDFNKCIDHVLNQKSFYSSRKLLFNSEEEYNYAVDIFDLLDSLTNTESKVLKLVCEGKTTEDIANILFVQPKSISNYRNKICRKLNLNTATNSLNQWVIENQGVIKCFF